MYQGYVFLAQTTFIIWVTQLITIPVIWKGYTKIPLALKRVSDLLAIAFTYVRIHMA